MTGESRRQGGKEPARCVLFIRVQYKTKMDVQMKRGLLDVCVLAAIQSEDSYGYQIIKDIRPYVDVSESTLYPILRRLEEGRLLTVRSMEHNGRLRKYYHITDAGKARIEDFKEDWRQIMSIYRFVTKEDEDE